MKSKYDVLMKDTGTQTKINAMENDKEIDPKKVSKAKPKTMKAIFLTSNKEKGQNVYTDKMICKIREEFEINNEIYTKKDIVSAAAAARRRRGERRLLATPPPFSSVKNTKTTPPTRRAAPPRSLVILIMFILLFAMLAIILETHTCNA